MRLTGEVALVTGGASGLGRATVEALRARGAQVVVLDLAGAGGGARGLPREAVVVEGDVREEADVRRAVERATELGGLRLCVSCAGVATPGLVLRKGEPLALDVFRAVVDVNLVGSFNVTRMAAAAMAQLEPVGEERGVIVNTASVAAYEGQSGQVAYAASKAGIVGMTLPLARDLARSRIRCVTIAPGVFETPLLQGLPADARASLAAAIPHPSRLGDPAEYAALVVHIAENPYLNGETIRLDAALRMQPR